MTISELDSHQNDIARAQWRVRSILLLLDSHRLLQARGPEWEAKETEFLAQLEKAHAELGRARELASTQEMACQQKLECLTD